MNKMTKGAIATAAGALLLVGGGGTLAVWNIQQDAEAGIVASGDLNLVAEKGVWTVAGQSTPIDISTYKIVPGDTLTYTQNVDITLDGDNISAQLSVVNPDGVNNGFVVGTYTTSPVTLKKNGVAVPSTLNDDVIDAVASVSFDFLTGTTSRQSVNATYNFSAVAFKLEQIAPADPAVP